MYHLPDRGVNQDAERRSSGRCYGAKYLDIDRVVREERNERPQHARFFQLFLRDGLTGTAPALHVLSIAWYAGPAREEEAELHRRERDQRTASGDLQHVDARNVVEAALVRAVGLLCTVVGCTARGQDEEREVQLDAAKEAEGDDVAERNRREQITQYGEGTAFDLRGH